MFDTENSNESLPHLQPDSADFRHRIVLISLTNPAGAAPRHDNKQTTHPVKQVAFRLTAYTAKGAACAEWVSSGKCLQRASLSGLRFACSLSFRFV